MSVMNVKKIQHACALKNLSLVICATPYPVRFLLRLPTCAWNPVLTAFTDRREPQDSQAMKKIRFSFVKSVSGDLHVLHVTYSTDARVSVSQRHITMSRLLPIYLLNTFSICFCWNRPLITNLPDPSTEPVVPNSANKYCMTCSGCRCIRLQMSLIFAKILFLLPSRWMEGGAIVYRFPVEVRRDGLEAWREA